jgi:ABC-type uncharacterized transport system ATPase subunit
VQENLEISIPQAHGVWASILFRRTPKVLARIEEIASEINLQDHLQKKSGLLSHGQKQWLEIGMLLMQEPELLLLDEPVAGMSPRERELTADLLRTISLGKSLVAMQIGPDAANLAPVARPRLGDGRGQEGGQRRVCILNTGFLEQNSSCVCGRLPRL